LAVLDGDAVWRCNGRVTSGFSGATPTVVHIGVLATVFLISTKRLAQLPGFTWFGKSIPTNARLCYYKSVNLRAVVAGISANCGKK
jgi:hypothetical protein